MRGGPNRCARSSCSRWSWEFVLGHAIAMPRVVEEDFGLEAGSAAVMAMFGAGMFLSSVVMVSRPSVVMVGASPC